jgi:hypothetical protein
MTIKQPKALRLADEILKVNCTKSNKEKAANELRRLHELTQALYKQMNEAWSLQAKGKSFTGQALNVLGGAISKVRGSEK